MLRTYLISCFTVCSIQALSIGKRSYCGNDAFLTQNNGVISSHAGMANGHTYGRNMDCVWKIEAPEGMMVELVAQQFDLEDDSTCDYDYLMLYDGKDTSATSMGKFCGTSFNPISSTGRFLTLRFITDGDTQAGGFSIFYNFTNTQISVCSSSQFKCANGRCISNLLRCDNADDCGDDSDETNCQGYTGSHVTGGSSTTCASDEFNCKDSTGCIPKTWLCDGDVDCDTPVDENLNNCMATATADPRCGELNQTGSTGTITSPNYPMTYDTDEHCFYHILAKAGTKNIAFKFDANFHLEPDNACDYDWVMIYTDINKLHKHGPFCGNTAPAEFTIAGDQAYVEFMSDDSDKYTGYRLDWKAIE